MKRKIVITGGHLTPALAVVEELVKRGNWEIFFFGRRYASEGEKTPSMERQIITDRGLWFTSIDAGRLQRKFTSQTVPALLKVPLGFFQSLGHLMRIRPQVILSFGGYPSVPVVLAGWLLRIPSVTHEQTAVLGLANKLNRPFVKKIALSWEKTEGVSVSDKTVLTGNPVRQEIFKPQGKLWQALKFEKDLPLIFVTGGNQGAHAVNQVVEKVLPKLLKRANVFHQCGHLKRFNDFEKLERAREKLPSKLKKRYHVKKYLSGEEMGLFFKKADLVISRAGANITTEVALFGLPALFIPLPWSHADEQNRNARMLASFGLAEVLPQDKLSPSTLSRLVSKMLADLDRYRKNAPQTRKLVKLDAAKKLVDLIEKQIQ